MYAVNQCSDPRDFVSPRYKTFKVSVLSSKIIFSIDAKTITSNVDVQKVRTAIFEEVKGKADISIKLVRVVIALCLMRMSGVSSTFLQ